MRKWYQSAKSGCYATQKIDNRKEVAKVSGRFYWSRLNVATTPQGLQLVSELNRPRAVFWACTKDCLWLIWSLRVFIGLWDVPKGLIFIADWFPTVLRSVSSRQEWELFAIPWRPIGNWSAMRQRSIGSSSATGGLLVGKWFPSMPRSLIRRWVCDMSPTCLRIISQEFREHIS